MRVMALDTTSRAGSVAIVEDGRIVLERAGDGSRTHGERLPGELAALGVGWSSVDVFAVCAGPGSFTGLRIGIATIQGLAFVARRPVVGISALEAVAQLASRDVAEGATIASWIDAHRGEVFSALYQISAAPLFTPERLVEIEAPAVASPSATLDTWSRRDLRSTVFAGDGAARYVPALSTGGAIMRLAQPALLAGAVGAMAAVRAERGEAGSPDAVRPLYIRRPDAELARERQPVPMKEMSRRGDRVDH
jgi:tRNA threonylcarbamoyladenosine biosynthesis protein TsaB